MVERSFLIPIGVMQQHLAERSEEESNKDGTGMRVALVLGPGMPDIVPDIYAAWKYLKGTRIELIPHTDSRVAAIPTPGRAYKIRV